MASEHDDRLAGEPGPDAPAGPPAADRRDDREHPAQPLQTDEGFAEGQERDPDTAEEERVGTFAEGQAVTPDAPEEEQIGRFSEGQDAGPETT